MNIEVRQDGIKKGILIILIANIANSVLNLITNFMLPKYLPEESYAIIKMFQLYISYAGILHFGYLDGIFLKYGGKNSTNISKRNLEEDLSTFRIFQLAVFIMFAIVSVLVHDYILLAFSISAMPYNTINYINAVYQATGEFRNYAKVTTFTVALTFICNSALVICGCKSGYPYIFITIIVNISVWIYLEFGLKKTFRCGIKIMFASFDNIISNIRMGFFLMLGTFSTIFLTSIDRWFIKYLMPIKFFAQYSFVVSIEGMMSIVITPISTTLYNFFCRNQDVQKIKDITNYVMIFACVVVSAAFPTKWIINNFLENYIPAIKVLYILFGMHIFSIVIKCIFTNLYKAKKQQKKYFFRMAFIVLLAVLLNILLFKITHAIEGFAVATLICNFIWLILCAYDFKKKIWGWRNYVYVLTLLIVYFILGLEFPPFVGMVIYLLFLFIITLLLFKRSMFELITITKDIIKDVIAKTTKGKEV